MMIEAAILSLIIGKIRKGKFRNLEHIQISGWYFFILAAFIQIGSAFVEKNNVISMESIHIYLHALSYIFVFIGLLGNIRFHSMKCLLLGSLLNFVVIMANGGKMPVSVEGLKALGVENIEAFGQNIDIGHMLTTEATRFRILSDMIPIPEPYPLPQMISIGDMWIAVGIFWFIQHMMRKEVSPQKVEENIEKTCSG